MMRIKKTLCFLILRWTALICLLLLTACDNEKEQTYNVGVINVTPTLNQTLEGFKAGMTELGYIEGKTIRYIYDGPTTDMGRLSASAHTLAAAKANLILSITTPATLAAKQETSHTGLPVVFAVVTDPVGANIVNSMQYPDDNITGVAFGIAEARRLEWLLKMAPWVKQIYVPYNPKDRSPVLALKAVRNAAEKLGIKLITREVNDSETLNDAVMNIPVHADAVFHLPDSMIGTRLSDLVATANNRKLPTSAANIMDVEKYHMLTSYGFDQYLCGRQAARLADQIFKGTRPADLPVEMTEFYLAVNLKVANAIGLSIPDDILRQADIIVR